jgi:diaminohydroxyphosphoribosylaminopyrimidine deaminase / 5-amino-6-(5-phosphoribosylamino)uracil reductase
LGKTPPCSDLILKKGIKRVVIGTTDPNPLVSGKGIKKLADAGIEVVSGILEKECRELNKFFFKCHEKQLPYVTLKIAQTLDGKIADPSYGSRWITGEKSRKAVHSFRSEYDAVLVGLNTVKVDNPFLDTRMVNGRNPKKIILDKYFDSDITNTVFGSGETIIITSVNDITKEEKFKTKGHKVIYLELTSEGGFDFSEMLKKIGSEGIISILVEGGSRVFSSFVRSGYFDELLIFTAPKIMGSGIPAIENIGVNKIENSLLLKPVEVRDLDGDIFVRYVK